MTTNHHRECWTVSPSKKDGTTRRINDRPIPCADCGATCAPGTAYIEKSATRGWIGYPINGIRS